MLSLGALWVNSERNFMEYFEIQVPDGRGLKRCVYLKHHGGGKAISVPNTVMTFERLNAIQRKLAELSDWKPEGDFGATSDGPSILIGDTWCNESCLEAAISNLRKHKYQKKERTLGDIFDAIGRVIDSPDTGLRIRTLVNEAKAKIRDLG